MSAPLFGLPEILRQRYEDVVSKEEERSRKLKERVNMETRLSNAHRYYNGTVGIHVHCSIGKRDLCAILDSSQTDIAQDSAVWHGAGTDHVLHGFGYNGQLCVTVLIGEPINDGEPVRDVWVVPSAIRRLQSLEDCNGTRGHMGGIGPPLGTFFESLLVFSLDGRFPYSLEEDGETDATAVCRWDKSSSQVLKAGSKVVNEVGDYQRDARIRGLGEDKTMNCLSLLLALDTAADRVGVAVGVSVDRVFEVTEVLVGPFSLEDERGAFSSHALALEDNAGDTTQPGTDAADTDGLHDPGAQP